MTPCLAVFPKVKTRIFETAWVEIGFFTPTIIKESTVPLGTAIENGLVSVRVCVTELKVQVIN